MTFFSYVTAADRVEIEGNDVREIIPISDPKRTVTTHYNWTVLNKDGEIEVRIFDGGEIQHLIVQELLIVDRNFSRYFPPDRQPSVWWREVFEATNETRRMIDWEVFIAQRMGQYHKLRMVLVRDAIDPFWRNLADNFKNFQA